MTKKLLALLMAAFLCLPVWPPQNVFANYQNPVTDLALTNLSPPTLDKTGEYRMNFKFTRPAKSDRSDPRALGENMDERATRFDLYWQNASPAGAQYNETNKVQFEDSTNNETIDYMLSPVLDFGRLYLYKITPWHAHQYPNLITPGGSPVAARAPMDMPEMAKEALYLSDIRVQAEGTDKEITVIWDNPTFHGGDLFTSYKIYYEQGGAQAKIDDATASYKSVSVTDAALIRLTGERKLSYTFENPGLDIGKLYAVKIVPEYDGKTIGEGKLTVKAGNKEVPITASGREYRTNDLYVKPSLTYRREGMHYLRLTWASYLNSMLDIDSAEIYESDKADFSDARNIAVISSPSAKTINYMLTERPLHTKYYKVILRYHDKTDPNHSVLRSLETMILAYHPAYEAFSPIKPAILQVGDTEARPYGLTITWEAFVRQAYTGAEKAAAHDTGQIIDKAVLYDLYITDDLTNFDAPNSTFMTQKIVDGLTADSLEDFLFDCKAAADVIKKPAYAYTVHSYITKENGIYVKKPVEDNKIYYIMIVAKREPWGETSAKSYYSHYYAPKRDIGVRPVTLAKPPLRIKKNADGIEMITKTSITAEWDTLWYEVYNSADGNWHAKAGVDNGKLVFGEKITEQMITENHVIELSGSLQDQGQGSDAAFSAIYERLRKLNVSEPEKSYPIRRMDLGGAQYGIHTAPHDAIQKAGGYDAYIRTLTAADWLDISPSGSGITLETIITSVNQPENAAALLPNTAYTILLRPFIVREDGREEAYHPNYIVATTLSDRPPLTVKPTVPVIEAVPPTTDRTVTVRFAYMTGLRYELFWSNYFPDYPANGTAVTDETLRAHGEIKQENGRDYLYYTLNNLFPETAYAIWVRTDTGQGESGAAGGAEYSNPVTITTSALSPPEPPQGLGLASKEHVQFYNTENGQTFQPVDDSYMIVEWLKAVSDTAVPGTAAPPENTAAELLASAALEDSYMLKFNRLIGNRAYYIRAKTRLTVTKKDAGSAGQYQYIVQLSPNTDFTDAVEAVVPVAKPDTDPANAITKDSAWTNAVRLMTGHYQDEYDGKNSTATAPLPVQDFELIYDRRTDTLTYRYRSNETDKNGNRDNQADQRFISKLVQNKAYNVVADVSAYHGHAVTNGAVDLPYSIVKAMADRKISLTVKASNLTLTFPAGFIETNEVKALALAPDSKIKITVGNAETGVPGIVAATYAATPTTASVAVAAQTGIRPLTVLAHPYQVSLKLTNRGAYANKNIAAYTYTKNDRGWVRLSGGQYSSETGEITFSAQTLSAYAAIAGNLPYPTAAKDVQNSMITVGKTIYITDMRTYNANVAATSGQINKLIAAIALNNPEVALNSVLTEAEHTALVKSGMLTSGGSVTREAALHALVKLYEVKTKAAIKDYVPVTKTPYKDISSASPHYQTALLKAAGIGFFDESFVARPKAYMTLGDLLYMADMILQDAGLN